MKDLVSAVRKRISNNSTNVIESARKLNNPGISFRELSPEDMGDPTH